MYLQTFKSIAVALAAAILVSGTAAAADAPAPASASAPASKWRVTFNGQSASDGEMQFRVTPHEGEPFLVTAIIHRGRGEMSLAQDVRDSFEDQLPKRRFRAEIFSGDKLQLKALSGEQDFLLELVQSNVDGSRIFVKPG
jgi:opacity protein-like surface antigen